MLTFIVIAAVVVGAYVFLQARKANRTMTDEAAVLKLQALEKAKSILQSAKSKTEGK